MDSVLPSEGAAEARAQVLARAELASVLQAAGWMGSFGDLNHPPH